MILQHLSETCTWFQNYILPPWSAYWQLLRVVNNRAPKRVGIRRSLGGACARHTHARRSRRLRPPLQVLCQPHAPSALSRYLLVGARYITLASAKSTNLNSEVSILDSRGNSTTFHYFSVFSVFTRCDFMAWSGILLLSPLMILFRLIGFCHRFKTLSNQGTSTWHTLWYGLVASTPTVTLLLFYELLER